MTVYTFDDQGIITSEIYTEVYNDGRQPFKAAEWHYDGKVLTCVTHGNIDKNGNRYTRLSKCDPTWWIKNKTRENLVRSNLISPESLGVATSL